MKIHLKNIQQDLDIFGISNVHSIEDAQHVLKNEYHLYVVVIPSINHTNIFYKDIVFSYKIVYDGWETTSEDFEDEDECLTYGVLNAIKMLKGI